MIPKEYIPLIDKLKERTINRTLGWETTSDSSKFTIDTGKNSMTIQTYTTFPEEIPVISLEILDMYGEIVDGVYISEEDNDYPTMKALYLDARRNALKIDETISNIMDFLNKK